MSQAVAKFRARARERLAWLRRHFIAGIAVVVVAIFISVFSWNGCDLKADAAEVANGIWRGAVAVAGVLVVAWRAEGRRRNALHSLIFRQLSVARPHLVVIKGLVEQMTMSVSEPSASARFEKDVREQLAAAAPFLDVVEAQLLGNVEFVDAFSPQVVHSLSLLRRGRLAYNMISPQEILVAVNSLIAHQEVSSATTG